MSVALQASLGVVALAAALIVALVVARRRSRPANVAFDSEPLDDDDGTTADPGPGALDIGPGPGPFGPDGEHGFFVHGESGREPDGTYLHTRTLRIAEGFGFTSLSLELIAPTLRRGELLRGDVIVDSAAAHGGVLTLQARDVTGRLIVRVRTTDPAERIRAYWRPGTT